MTSYMRRQARMRRRLQPGLRPGATVICITESAWDDHFIHEGVAYTCKRAFASINGEGLIELEERPGFTYLAEHFEPAEAGGKEGAK